jgi:hypothetical protein
VAATITMPLDVCKTLLNTQVPYSKSVDDRLLYLSSLIDWIFG